ncbi:MAG: glycosyltransferase family 4 protein [Coriobacteriia bacterium]|nr:glycosyltransferase family 4 protein [Coriobacteriia bacterium]
MRVAIDCRMAGWSGVGRYTRGLVRALAKRGDVEVVQVLAPEMAPLADAGAVVAHGHPFSPAGAAGLARALTASGADVAHCAHFPTPLRAKMPLVVTIHDLIPLRVPESMPRRTARAAYRAMVARAVRMADAIVVPSAQTARDLEAYWPQAAPKTRVVPLAADDFVEGPHGALPRWLTGRRYLLAMANPKPHKGRRLLIDAFDAVASEFPEVLLVLVGDEGEAARSGERASHDPDRVRFTGQVDDATLRGLYANAEAFVFPSFYEGFGLPPLEAMALGAPVITTAAASLPEVVGDAALSVPAGDASALREAIRRMLEDEQLRGSLAERGRTRASEFSWDRTAELTVQVYRDVVRP